MSFKIYISDWCFLMFWRVYLGKRSPTQNYYWIITIWWILINFHFPLLLGGGVSQGIPKRLWTFVKCMLVLWRPLLETLVAGCFLKTLDDASWHVVLQISRNIELQGVSTMTNTRLFSKNKGIQRPENMTTVLTVVYPISKIHLFAVSWPTRRNHILNNSPFV